MPLPTVAAPVPADALTLAGEAARGRGLVFLDDVLSGCGRVLRDPAAVFRSKEGQGELAWADGRRPPGV